MQLWYGDKYTHYDRQIRGCINGANKVWSEGKTACVTNQGSGQLRHLLGFCGHKRTWVSPYAGGAAFVFRGSYEYEQFIQRQSVWRWRVYHGNGISGSMAGTGLWRGWSLRRWSDTRWSCCSKACAADAYHRWKGLSGYKGGCFQIWWCADITLQYNSKLKDKDALLQ